MHARISDCVRRGMGMASIPDDVSCFISKVKKVENFIACPCLLRGHFNVTWHLGPALRPVLRVLGAPKPYSARMCALVYAVDPWMTFGRGKALPA